MAGLFQRTPLSAQAGMQALANCPHLPPPGDTATPGRCQRLLTDSMSFGGERELGIRQVTGDLCSLSQGSEMRVTLGGKLPLPFQGAWCLSHLETQPLLTSLPERTGAFHFAEEGFPILQKILVVLMQISQNTVKNHISSYLLQNMLKGYFYL